MEEPLSEIPPTTVESQVLERLREAILKGKFEPGKRLNQVKIAQMFGTSRGPVRAALRKLEDEGLVQNVPHRGTRVTPLDLKTVRELYGVRAVLESYAVRSSMPLCTEEDIDYINSIIEKMQAAAAEGETDEVVHYDFLVHEFFIKRTENSVLMQTWSTLKLQIQRALTFRHYSYPRLKEIADSHLFLLDTMKSKNAEKAAEVMEAHILDALDDLVNRWTLSSSSDVAV